MTIENTRLRNEFINTQIITQSSGKKLGVVKEVLVDIDQREVVALSLRDNMLSISGIPKHMYLDAIKKTGDVVLVEDEDAIEDVNTDIYSTLINCEVITETGEPLGRVRDFQFNIDTGKVSSLIIASLGIPQIPDQMISTYEISVEEIVSSGPNRIIVFEGAEDRISQVTVGLLERLGIGRPPWERDDEEIYYPPTARPENQLGTGIPISPPVQQQPQRTPIREEAWDEDDDWREERRPEPRRAEVPLYNDYEEESNWDDTPPKPMIATYEETPPPPLAKDDNVEQDVWDDDTEAQPYEAPPLNIPEKQIALEYEEETNY
ncbi:MAG: photosystem reaction center subunit H [Synechococcaceae cyanobacterium RL_1_2]|nr:photosystem reaction center subunit H [Synechococcaceae cyanobacterium RL_1_2]